MSIVIPAYNAEEHIGRGLKSLTKQTYPKDKLEIIVADGRSSDRTIEIAKNNGARVVVNEKRDAQIGKAVGIKHAKGQIIALLDADNEVVQKDWLEKLLIPLLEDPDIFGVESNYLRKKNDYLANRYCALLCLEYPIARCFSLLKNCAHKEDRGSYIVYTVKENKYPAVGANGFLWRRKVLESLGGFKKSFDEGDISARAYLKGYRKIGNYKRYGIYHHHIKTVGEFLRKRVRTGREFLARKRLKTKKKETIWLSRYNELEFILAVIYCLSFIGPLIEAMKGYIIDRDIAWFLHPPLCFATVVIYGFTFLEHLIHQNFGKVSHF